MADPRAVVPYHDPYNGEYGDDVLNFIACPNPSFIDLSLNQGPFSQPSSVPQSSDQIADANDPFDDPVMWGLPKESNAGDSQAGPSGIHGETSNRGEEKWQVPENSDSGNSRTLSVWPPEPVPFGCSCCLVLREIIHTNGQDVTRLEIHGRLGLICHAILEIQQNASSVSEGQQYQMFDFCKKSIDGVKQFLVQYCLERKQAGFIMVPDPLSIFYEAMCVGILDWDENMLDDDFIPSFSPNSGPVNMDQSEAANGTEKTPRTSLSAQRIRTGKLTLKDIGNYFHLPIEEASKKLKLCPTVMKKICRRDGLNRWPHRKIKSLERKISILKPSLSSSNAEERGNAQAEIQMLQEKMDKVCAGLA